MIEQLRAIAIRDIGKSDDFVLIQRGRSHKSILYTHESENEARDWALGMISEFLPEEDRV